MTATGTATIVDAELVQYDAATDLRTPTGHTATADELDGLSDAVRGGHATLTAGLLGWEPYTHTLRHHDDDSTWHVRLS